MTDQHPITPPPELVEEWIAQVWHEGTPVQVSASDLHLASKAAEWGARYGHQPAPPAEGEVRGLVAELREIAQLWEPDAPRAKQLFRAADLLHRLSPPQPPVEGEVAELVRLLGSMAAEAELADQVHDASVLDRAADLLQRLSPPQPVPVSERLPGPEDCDAEGRCGVGRSEYDFPMGDTGKYGHADPEWCLEKPPTQREMANSPFTWLPATALPVPGQEVG